MASRKWLIRSLYLLFLAALIAGGFYAYAWTKPGYVRQQVIQHLQDTVFTDVQAEVGSARLRFLGGISVTDLQLFRKDDPSRSPFLQVPSAVLYHDKEQLNEGHLVIRKVELDHPTLRLERDESGHWNIDDLFRPGTNSQKPIFVLKQAHIILIDHLAGPLPLADWTGIDATIVNDPISLFTFKFHGTGTPTGPFTLDGRYDTSQGLHAALDLPDLAFNSGVVRCIRRFDPEWGAHLEKLQGKGTVHLDLNWTPGAVREYHYDLHVNFHDGCFENPQLPWALSELAFSAQAARWRPHGGTGERRFGDMQVKLGLQAPDLFGEGVSRPVVAIPVSRSKSGKEPPPPPGDELEALIAKIQKLDLTVERVRINRELFEKLPPAAKQVEDMLAPSGIATLHMELNREAGKLHRLLRIQPDGMNVTYSGFPYPLKNLRGTVEHTSGIGEPDRIGLNLTAEGGGTNVNIDGTIINPGPHCDVNIKITGKNAVLDEQLISAIPGDSPAKIRRLRPAALGDFVALIRQNDEVRRIHGPDEADNEFTIQVHKGSLNYIEFPYLMENLEGTLIIHTVPDHPTRLPPSPGVRPAHGSDDLACVEFRDFTGTHKKGRIRGSGRQGPTSGGTLLTLNLQCEEVDLDNDLRTALEGIHVENAWNNFEPRGRMNCNLAVRVNDRTAYGHPFNAADDLELAMSFSGAGCRPTFFPYTLTDVEGRLSYARGRSDLHDFSARHGASQILLPATEILFRPGGGYWAELRDLRVTPLVVERELLHALPPGLRAACEGLELKGPMSLYARKLVLDEQPGLDPPYYLPPSSPAQDANIVRANRSMEQTRAEAMLTSSSRQQPTYVARATLANLSETNNRPGSPLVPYTLFPDPSERPSLPTIYWDGALTMAGASMNTGVPWEEVHGKFASWGIYKAGRLGTVHANLLVDHAQVAAQPMQDVSAQFHIDPNNPEVLQVPSLRGKLFGGDVGGEAWVQSAQSRPLCDQSQCGPHPPYGVGQAI